MNTVKAVNFRLPEFVGFQFGIMKKKSYLLVINLELWRKKVICWWSICRLSICRLSICRMSICRLSIIRLPILSVSLINRIEQFRKQTYSLTSRYYAVPITQCCPNFSALSQWLSAVPWFSALLMTRRCPNYSALSQWLSTVPITQCCPNDSALSQLLSTVKMTPCFPIDSVLNRQHLALTRTTMSKDKCKYLCQFAKNCKIG